MNKIELYKINEILENRYYQIPQGLFENPLYQEKLNSDAKILYGFLLDRLTLSKRNNWINEKGEVYLIFTRTEVQEKLNLSDKPVCKAFKQLKQYFKLSDRGLIDRTRTDMLFKYFLGYLPEDTNLIDPSLLTVFRRERLSNSENEDETSNNLMDKLIAKTVEIAISKGVINVKNKLIQDSTHTNARFQHISPREELIRQAKLLRKAIYKIDETMHDKMILNLLAN